MGSDKAGAGEGGAGGKSRPRRRAAADSDLAAPRPALAELPRRPDLGPRPLGTLIPRLTRPAFKRKSPAGAMLMVDWVAVVGPAIAAVTVPLRLSAGTLTIACGGPVAMELQHLAPQLIGRINAALGAVAVQTLRFVQRAPPAAPTPPRRAEARLPEAVRGALGGVASPELRDALERLGRGVYRGS